MQKGIQFAFLTLFNKYHSGHVSVTYVIATYVIHFPIKPLHSTERNACLCTRHQNFALNLRALKSVKNMRIINNDVIQMSFKKY